MKYRKLFLGFCFVLVLIFEITYFILLFTDTTYLGVFINPFTVEYSLFVQIFLLIFIILFLGSGLLFSRKGLRSEKKELKLKAKFLAIAFTLFFLGCIFDISLPISEFTVVIIRIILTFSSIFLYLGFILPDWVKARFLKEV